MSDPSSPAAAVRGPEDGPNIWFGEATYTFRVTAEMTDGSLTVLDASVPPGSGPPAHVHHRTDETFLVGAGVVEFLSGSSLVLANAGDLVFVPRGLRHRFRVVGTHPARLTILFTPGGMDSYFTAVGDPARPGQPAPPMDPHHLRLVRELADEHDLVFVPEPDAPRAP